MKNRDMVTYYILTGTLSCIKKNPASIKTILHRDIWREQGLSPGSSNGSTSWRSTTTSVPCLACMNIESSCNHWAACMNLKLATRTERLLAFQEACHNE
jgi:hypothetical protein